MEVPAMQDGCPWSELSHWAPPTVKWCEAQVCGWIVEPANTWSNLAYVFIGAWLLWRARSSGAAIDRVFGWAQIAVGLSSLAYHASYTFVLQILDFFGMYVFTGLLVVFNLVRLGVVARDRMWSVYGWAVLGLTVATPFVAHTRFPIQAIVGVLILVTLGTEVAIKRAATGPVRYREYVASLAFIAAAAACSAADVSRVWCDPSNHLVQGHAAWHVLGAVSLGFSWAFYRQFAELFAGTKPALAGV